MEQGNANLFRRRDTFFGICEAVGQDFGFNPLYLRLALIAPLFFFPVQTFAAYFTLGLIVLASRLLFPAESQAVADQPRAAGELLPLAPEAEPVAELAFAA